MNALLHLIEHWLAPEAVPEPQHDAAAMSDALREIHEQVDQMETMHRKLQARVAVAEAIASVNARSHGYLPMDYDAEGKPK